MVDEIENTLKQLMAIPKEDYLTGCFERGKDIEISILGVKEYSKVD